jgi:oligoendopeptidase F
MNFSGTLRDVATLAHELGHGIHFVLAQEQRLVNYHPPLPLAETASVFGEMLLTSHLLKQNPDRQTKIALLCATIEDIIATTCRQVMLTRFEEKLHHERSNGLVTTERICELWTTENARLFGSDVLMIEPYRWGWSYISHFIHTRFYCYAYTFAELLVLSLFRLYQQQGTAFIPTYRQILASGGSLSPADTVAPAGISLETTQVWQQGYALVGDLIAELEATIAP